MKMEAAYSCTVLGFQKHLGTKRTLNLNSHMLLRLLYAERMEQRWNEMNWKIHGNVGPHVLQKQMGLIRWKSHSAGYVEENCAASCFQNTGNMTCLNPSRCWSKRLKTLNNTCSLEYVFVLVFESVLVLTHTRSSARKRNSSHDAVQKQCCYRIEEYTPVMKPWAAQVLWTHTGPSVTACPEESRCCASKNAGWSCVTSVVGQCTPQMYISFAKGNKVR